MTEPIDTEGSPVAPPAEETGPTTAVATPDRRRQREWWEVPRVLVPLYTVAFVLIEVLGVAVGVEAQAIAEAVAALVAVNHAVLGHRTQRTAGLVMAALFTARLTSFVLPSTTLSTPARTVVVGAVSVLTCYLAGRVLRTDIATGRADEGMPLKRPLVSASFTSAITVLSGFPMGWIGYQLLGPEKLDIHPLAGTEALPWVLAIGALLVGAIGEELLYRRMVAAMVAHTARSQTPLFSALLFGASYLGTQDIGFVALTTVAGGFFAWSCERTGSIRPTVIAHFIASVLVFVVLPA